jgi:hypothetical protein
MMTHQCINAPMHQNMCLFRKVVLTHPKSSSVYTDIVPKGRQRISDGVVPFGKTRSACPGRVRRGDMMQSSLCSA